MVCERSERFYWVRHFEFVDIWYFDSFWALDLDFQAFKKVRSPLRSSFTEDLRAYPEDLHLDLTDHQFE